MIIIVFLKKKPEVRDAISLDRLRVNKLSMIRRKSELPQNQSTLRALEQHQRPDAFLKTQPDN